MSFSQAVNDYHTALKDTEAMLTRIEQASRSIKSIVDFSLTPKNPSNPDQVEFVNLLKAESRAMLGVGISRIKLDLESKIARLKEQLIALAKEEL